MPPEPPQPDAVPELGLVEGFFGRPWNWDERRAALECLVPAGYGFHLYAPKADAHLRRRWREPHPAEAARDIRAFARFCAERGVRFGIGLSPFEIFNDWNPAAARDLADRVGALAELGCVDLGLFFDDMRATIPDLAARQVEIAEAVRAAAPHLRLILCPTYYSDDPVLDRVFGRRPETYLADLGRWLDPAIELCWTGPEVCSRELSPGHIERVGRLLGRKPFLWDNYPVNDGPRMSERLHLRAFTGRPAALAGHIRAHGVNPASQAILGCLPALTLAMSYRQGATYCYGAAFREAGIGLLGPDLFARVEADLIAFEDQGLAALEPRLADIKARYAAYDHPAAREIGLWLSGHWRTTRHEIETQ